MVRTQIRLTDEQFRSLEALAREGGRSVADLVRQSVDEYLARRPTADRAELIRRARGLVGRYRSGVPDLAEDHDRHLDDAFSAHRAG